MIHSCILCAAGPLDSHRRSFHRTRLMANYIRQLWLTRREQQPLYVLCTPSARERLRMRVRRARASRAPTSVVHSFGEASERSLFESTGRP